MQMLGGSMYSREETEEVQPDQDQADGDTDGDSLGSFDPEGDHDAGPRHAAPRRATLAASASNKCRSSGSRSKSSVVDSGVQFLADSSAASKALVDVKRDEIFLRQQEMAETRKIEREKLDLAREVEERKLAAQEKKNNLEAFIAMSKAFPDKNPREIKALFKMLDENDDDID
jgi:hypothetical protein